jgi:anti-anti-sigma factor
MSAPPAQHYFEWEDAGGVAVVRFTITTLRDDRIIRPLFEQLEQLAEASNRRQMIINFSGIEAFASYAIGKLIVLNNKLQPPAGKLALCHLTPIIDEIVDIMRLRKHFNIHRTEQEAIQSFR